MVINKRFKSYIDEKNFWISVSSGYKISFPLSQGMVDNLGRYLSSDLSPENLHCDGEISAKQAGVKYRKLMGVVKDLNKYCEKKGLAKPDIYY